MKNVIKKFLRNALTFIKDVFRFVIIGLIVVFIYREVIRGWLFRGTSTPAAQHVSTGESSLVFDIEKALHTKNLVPLVVIGSGPAGLSAALYGARSSLYTLVFEGKTPGGQLTETTYVENWPGTPRLLGAELIDIARKQAERFGAIFAQDSIAAVDFSQWPFLLKTEEGNELHALAVVIATGAKPRLLSDTRKTPGEKEYWAHGVSTCAVCDAPFFKGKKVIVVGGGDSAVEEATYLASYASSVTMLVRGSALRAAPAMQARLKDSPSITVVYNTSIEEILGNDSLSVNAVKVYNNQEKKSSVIPVDGVFLAIGHHPNSDVFKQWIETDAEGYIKRGADLALINIQKIATGAEGYNAHSQQTTVQGVFAAGDVTDRVYKQAGVAAGDGIKAALDAYAFLQEHGYSPAFARKAEKNYYDPHPDTGSYTLTKILSEKDFQELVKKHPLLVIEVGAEHCASCKTLAKTLQSIAPQFEDKASFATISLNESSQDLIKRFNLKSVPALLIFKKGELVARFDQQLFSKRELYVMINQHL